jgi:hypothetical protein
VPEERGLDEELLAWRVFGHADVVVQVGRHPAVDFGFRVGGDDDDQGMLHAAGPSVCCQCSVFASRLVDYDADEVGA